MPTGENLTATKQIQNLGSSLFWDDMQPTVPKSS